MSSMKIEYPHKLPVEDVRARIKALGEYLQKKHGIGVTWSGTDQADVKGRYLVVAIEGSVTIAPDAVRFEGKDPGMLWRGKAKDYLTAKLKKYLDPQTGLESLPRA